MKEKIKQVFMNTFHQEPVMIASPGRINIIGEHTDYNQGFVLPAAIDKYIYVAGQSQVVDEVHCIALDKNEELVFSLQESLPKFQKGSWQNYIIGIIGELSKIGINIGGMQVVFGGDIPLGAGLSSSAALENGIVFLCNELFDLGLTPEAMIRISQKAEHNYAGVQCGIMDQYASMFGKQHTALFLDCKTVTSKEIPIEIGGYEWILINTNVKHSLANSAYNDRRALCENVASRLGKESLRTVTKKELESIREELKEDEFEKITYILEENARVTEMVAAFQKNEVQIIGSKLYASHRGLQHQYKVSCDELDFLIEETKKYPEILGARMMGGGFGGCTLNLIKTGNIELVVETIQKSFTERFGRKTDIYKVSIGKGTYCF